MATNLSRKQANAQLMQSKLQFSKKDKPLLVDCEMQTDSNKLSLHYNIFEYSFPIFKKIEIEQNVPEQYIQKQQDKEFKNQNKEIFKCNQCNIIFAFKHTLHRNFEKQHLENHSIYLNHEKTNRRYAYTTCDKTYSHSRDLKHHMQKINQTDFQVKDLETDILIPAKNKDFQKLKRIKRKVKETKTYKVYYIHVVLPHEQIAHSINGFTYKIYPLKYLVEKGSRSLQFSNEYAILMESKQRRNQNLLLMELFSISIILL